MDRYLGMSLYKHVSAFDEGGLQEKTLFRIRKEDSEEIEKEWVSFDELVKDILKSPDAEAAAQRDDYIQLKLEISTCIFLNYTMSSKLTACCFSRPTGHDSGEAGARHDTPQKARTSWV